MAPCRVRGSIDRRFFAQLLIRAFALVLIAASVITVVEKRLTFSSLGASVNWGVQTILGQGDSSYVTGPIGWVVGWFFSLFGVAIIGTLTGALVALVIDFLLKEGQGLGASGYKDPQGRLGQLSESGAGWGRAESVCRSYRRASEGLTRGS